LSLDAIPDCYVYGDMSPECTGEYHIAGTFNGKAYYSRVDSARYIVWDGVDSWYISTTISIPTVQYWKLTAPSHIGIYAPVGTATGNTIVTTYEGIKYNFTGTVSPDVVGPVYQLGMKEGKGLYINLLGDNYMQWFEADKWIVSENLAVPDSAGYWSATRADPPGVLAPTAPNTGELTCALP